MSEEEKLFGKLVREDENFSWYDRGPHKYGVCIPKKAFFKIVNSHNDMNKIGRELIQLLQKVYDIKSIE